MVNGVDFELLLRTFINSSFPIYINTLTADDSAIVTQSQALRQELISFGSKSDSDAALLLEQSMHICEVFFLHSDVTLSIEMTKWLRQSCFTEDVEILSQLESQSHPERDPRYWSTVYHLLLRF